MYKRSFDFIVEKAMTVQKPIRVIIAGADCENVLLGAFQAEQRGFAELVLCGDEGKITAMLKELGLVSRKYTIEAVSGDEDVVQHAIDYIKAGKADVLMRGNVQTRDFLIPVLKKENDLVMDGRLLTQVTMLKFAGYDRILAISDVTVIPTPNQTQRKQVIYNMAKLFNKFGYEKPNIALLGMTEQVAFHLSGSVEAQTIVNEHQGRPIADCNLVGPVPYDLIVSKEAARLKGYENPLAGEFDGIVVPDLLTGNVLVKALQMNGNASSCGVIVGAKVPIALTSRSDTQERAYLSLAACAAMTLDR